MGVHLYGRCQASAGATRQASAGAGVEDQPEPVSRISRNSVKDQVTPERPASPGTRQDGVPSAGIEPAARGLGNLASADTAGDRDAFPLVDALQGPQSTWVNRRCWPQGGPNSAQEVEPLLQRSNRQEPPQDRDVLGGGSPRRRVMDYSQEQNTKETANAQSPASAPAGKAAWIRRSRVLCGSMNPR